jgi:hypothetical protein
LLAALSLKPMGGLEPSTPALRKRCSTVELHRRFSRFLRASLHFSDHSGKGGSHLLHPQFYDPCRFEQAQQTRQRYPDVPALSRQLGWRRFLRPSARAQTRFQAEPTRGPCHPNRTSKWPAPAQALAQTFDFGFGLWLVDVAAKSAHCKGQSHSHRRGCIRVSLRFRALLGRSRGVAARTEARPPAVAHRRTSTISPPARFWRR